MTLNIKYIYLTLCIIDMTLCVAYWLFAFAKKQINKHSVGTTKAIKIINGIFFLSIKVESVIFFARVFMLMQSLTST